MTDALQEWILEFESGRLWYGKLVSDVTKRIYLKRLKDYCDAVEKNPDELIQLKVEGLQNIGTAKEFQAETLLETFLATVDLTNDMKVSLKTAVMSFYAKNRRRLEPDVAENVERGEPKKRCPKTEDIVELENAMTCQRDKAILWFIASTAIRVGTIPKLKWKDLKPIKDREIPYYLKIEGARLKGGGVGKYKGVKQVSFVHGLAVKKLKNYRLEAKRRGYTLTKDSPLFISYWRKGKTVPFSPYTIEGMFADASLNAWHNLDAKRFSPHDFRNFVQSALENAGVNVNIIKPLLAHKPKGVDFHYSVHEIMDFMEKYRTALPYLLPQSVEKLKAEVEETKAEYEVTIANLIQSVVSIKQDFKAFKEDVNEHLTKIDKAEIMKKLKAKKTQHST